MAGRQSREILPREGAAASNPSRPYDVTHTRDISRPTSDATSSRNDGAPQAPRDLLRTSASSRQTDKQAQKPPPAKTIAEMAHARAQQLINQWEEESQPATEQVDPTKLVERYDIARYAKLQKEHDGKEIMSKVFERMPAFGADHNIGYVLARGLEIDTQVPKLKQEMQFHEQFFPGNAQIEAWRQEPNPYTGPRFNDRRIPPLLLERHESAIQGIRASPPWNDATVQHWNRQYHDSLKNGGKSDGRSMQNGIQLVYAYMNAANQQSMPLYEATRHENRLLALKATVIKQYPLPGQQ